MQFVEKAVLDSVLGANFGRPDISPVITMRDAFPRPVSEAAEVVRATNEIHQWREDVTGAVGTGTESYAEGARPNTVSSGPIPSQNITCRTGYTAQVTDEMTAVWYGAGAWTLDDAQARKLFTEALEYQIFKATRLTLKAIEFMHIQGDSSNPQGTGVFAGGQTDGLIKWGTNAGTVVNTGGSSGSPVQFAEAMIRAGAAAIAEAYSESIPNKLLVPAEFRTTINAFVGAGAAQPLVRMVGTDGAMLGGNQVNRYDTGYSVVEIVTEPFLSPSQNPYITNACAILYNDEQVKHAQLLPLATQRLAKTDTSVSTMITCTYAQEHRNPLGIAIMPNTHS